MGYMPPVTVQAVLDLIRRQEMVLPAIQREFVWREQKICALFDSLMRSYPIGGFLSWRIGREHSHLYTHYGFLARFHERDSRHCPVLPPQHDRELVAVLDGQQRLTSLYLGFFGTYATKEKYRRAAKDDSYPERRLHLDLLATPSDEDGWDYRFAFLHPARAADESDGSTCYWFPVQEITDPSRFSDAGKMAVTLFELTSSITDEDARRKALGTLGELRSMYWDAKLLTFHEEQHQDPNRVLDIFVRVNSGGQTLSKSDLLMSIATAQWENRDARAEITRTVEELNEVGRGFAIRRDLVLKSGLMCCGISDVGFKVANFTKDNMAKLEAGWDEVATALNIAVRLAASYGFDARRLTADSPLIAIAYYCHRRGLGPDYLTAVGQAQDRERIRQWLIRSLLRQGVWGSGLDTTLRRIRDVIDEHGTTEFPTEPLNTLFRERGRPLTFDEADVDLLLQTEYGSPQAFTILSLIDTSIDTRDVYDVDHVVPRSWFTPKRTAEAGIAKEDAERIRDLCNQLPNLQLLRSNDNKSKQDRSPAEWFELIHPNEDDRARVLNSLLIDHVPQAIDEFESFYEKRARRMAERLGTILGVERTKDLVPG